MAVRETNVEYFRIPIPHTSRHIIIVEYSSSSNTAAMAEIYFSSSQIVSGQRPTNTLHDEDREGVKRYNCEIVQNDAMDKDTLICALHDADRSAVSSVKINASYELLSEEILEDALMDFAEQCKPHNIGCLYINPISAKLRKLLVEDSKVDKADRR